MIWHVKYEAKKNYLPWSVYNLQGARDVYETGFSSQQEAERWIEDAEKNILTREVTEKPESDTIQEASEESFPASDPPAWTKVTTR